MICPENAGSIADIRDAIDEIDCEIVSLLASRASYVHKAASFKKDESAVRDEARVEKVIDSRRAMAKDSGVNPDLVEAVYRTMIDFFVKEEMEEFRRTSR